MDVQAACLFPQCRGRNTGGESDFEIQKQAERIIFELKFYNSDYALNANLKRACETFRKISGEEPGTLVLVVGNIVEPSTKERFQKQYDMLIWDVKNLRWMFEEYPDIKNEFISLLAYSVDGIEAEAPVQNLFDVKSKEPEEPDWKNKLQSMGMGRENYQKYEEVCIEILKYVLGECLGLWAVQEKSNDGLYRFDLCCKIKNGVNQGFFDIIQNCFQTKYIVFIMK